MTTPTSPGQTKRVPPDRPVSPVLRAGIPAAKFLVVVPESMRLDPMRASRITVAFLSLVAILAIAPDVVSSPPPAEDQQVSRVDAMPQLEPNPGPGDSTPLHTITEGFTGGAPVEAPRRLAGLRVQAQLRQPATAGVDEPGHTALLRLREATRDHLEVGNLLERDTSGAASFHTTTPPPHATA